MVIGEKDGTGSQPTMPAQMVAPPSSIENIMSGISNTGAVKMNNHRKKLRQRFDIIKKLGQGTYGKVQLGINKETGQEVAIKTIKKCKIETEADLVRIRREVQIMSSVQHPNIIHIYEVFENREKMVLVMEFAAGGELYDYLSERKVLSEEEARRVFRQISTAVYYCHKHKICHRDLKLENILLDENGNAKIADFGLSNVFDDQRLLATFCGSPLYASPEIVKGTPYQGPEVDCWSLGVLLYTLVYGAMPFDGSNFKRLVKQISAGDYYEPKKPSNASPLIREMLTVCPKRRSTIEQICNHWWVNENYTASCLDLAEELANQTPVRLDVLLSLAPSAITSDQLVVPNSNENDNKQNVTRSMSVGSVRDIADIANTEAERRIIDMVAAGGEAALAPSPTRTMAPSEVPVQQPKRKPETTISTESVIGEASVGARKRDKLTEKIKNTPLKLSISEVMDVEQNERVANQEQQEKIIAELSSSTLPEVMGGAPEGEEDNGEKPRVTKKKANVDTIIEEVPPTPLQSSLTGEPKTTTKKPTKTKTTDLSEISPTSAPSSLERNDSIPDDSAIKPSNERRRSRILETAEKFQGSNAVSDKPKKITIPGVSVDNHKKEFERKVSLTTTSIPPTIVPAEKRLLINSDSIDEQDPPIIGSRNDSIASSTGDEAIKETTKEVATSSNVQESNLVQSDSKSSNLSLDEARRSMENSIALLNQAKTESNSEVDQLCAKTENVAVSGDIDAVGDRQKKLKNAREIIGNAIPRLSGMGVRKPPVPFGANGRSVSGSVVPSPTAGTPIVRNVSTPADPKSYERESPLSIYNSRPVAVAPPPEKLAIDEEQPIKVSTAEITLKSATLPRRKIDAPKFSATKEPTTSRVESRYPSDMRSAPIRENQYQLPYSPVFAPSNTRATSLEPQQQQRPKEHFIPIQRPGGGYIANATSSSQRSMGAPLSRQSTNDSDTSDTQTSTTTMGGQSTITSNSSQPIKKSPREFIIPIAVEGGGFVTPRAGSLEPSDSNHSTSTAFSRFSGRPRKISSIFNDRDSEDESTTSPFHRMHRHTSIGRDSDSEDPTSRFTYRLRSTRPVKKLQTTDINDSGSSGEEDDEDGFEILTAENLFSTLLSRVRALTNRLNVKDDPSSNFPSSRFMNNLRQTHSPFWHHDPFTSRLNSSGAWRHSMTRDLGTDIDSMFSSRTGATLPRGATSKTNTSKNATAQQNEDSETTSYTNATTQNENNKNRKSTKDHAHPSGETLDLADLDLSQLRLTKKDLETLSNITPNLPKHFQDQLLAQLPPNQARKLSRTLSMQATGSQVSSQTPRVYKRSLSSGRDVVMHHDSANVLSSLPSKVDSAKAALVEDDKSLNDVAPPLPFDRNSVLRRSLSRSRETAANVQRRSTNEIRTELPTRLSYTGDLRSDYPVTKPGDSLASRYRLNDYTSALPPSSIRTDYYSRLPTPNSTCLSPPPISPQKSPSNDTIELPIRRRSSQRRISRFLRPDFYDSTSNIAAASADDSSLTKAKKERERETQSVLREIRERSRDRARQDSISYLDSSNTMASTSSHYTDSSTTTEPTPSKEHRRKSSIPNIRLTVDKQNGRIYHARNKSVERCCDIDDTSDLNLNEETRNRRSSTSMSRNIGLSSGVAQEKQISNESGISFTDQILNELVQRSQEQRAKCELLKPEEQKASIDACKKLKTKSKDGKKLKSKQKSMDANNTDSKQTTSTEKVNNVEMVTTLTNEIDSVTLPLPKTASKLVRPKSYPNKDELETKKSVSDKPTTVETKVIFDTPEIKSSPSKQSANDVSVEITLRPKSYPNSKLTPPKEIVLKTTKKSSAPNSAGSNGSARNAITAVMEKFIEKSAERLSPAKSTLAKVKTESDETTPKLTKKKVKIVKKVSKSDQSTPTKEASPRKTDEPSKEPSPTKERKSSEKKPGRGFLYTIGQKFEKMRENSKYKEKERKSSKSAEVASAMETEKLNSVKVSQSDDKAIEKPIRLSEAIDVPVKLVQESELTNRKTEVPIRKTEVQSMVSPSAAVKSDQRKSRIDAMIRNLRERSVPHSNRAENPNLHLATESALIKRAVSVEDMLSNGMPSFNKCNVNKVLGLFRRIEREQQLQNMNQLANQMNMVGNVNGTETSNILDSDNKERPKSGGYVSKTKKNGRQYYTGAKSDTIITLTDQFEKKYLTEKVNQTLASTANASTNTMTVTTKIPLLKTPSNVKRDKGIDCPDCGTSDCKDITNAMEDGQRPREDLKRHSRNKSSDPIKSQIQTTNIGSEAVISEKERIRNNRKGLVLDLSNGQYDVTFNFKTTNNNNNINNNNANNNGSNNNNINNNNSNNNSQHQYTTNGDNHIVNNNHTNGISSNINNNNNNYNFHGHSHQKNGRNGTITPSYENAPNYSSDSRSVRDDCESTSTFLSPTDEPELYFDDWSACSGSTDDHTQISPLPKPPKYTPLRSSYQQPEQNHHANLASAVTEPSSTPSDSESVIDRIKRRSFYCRFNEKKPKRSSSIVGPAARDYYRDMAAKSKPHPSDYLPTSNSASGADFGYRGNSKSPAPMHMNESIGRATSPSSYSTADENDDSKTHQHYHHPHHHHYHYHHTPTARSSNVHYDNDGHKVKSNDYLNLRSTLTSPPAAASISKYYSHSIASPSSLPTSEYQSNGNLRPYSTRNSLYDNITPSASSSSAASSTSPFIYGTYNPKRRVSTSYLAPSIGAVSGNGFIGSAPEHHLTSNCYATLGHRAKPKAYDHRSLSLMDSGSISPSCGLSRRIGSTATSGDHQYPHYRSVHDYGNYNSRSSLRSPPISRSPTSNV